MRKFWIFAGILLLVLMLPFHITVIPKTVEAESAGRIVGLLAYGSDSRIPSIFVYVRSLDGTIVREGISRYNPEKFQPYKLGYEIEDVPIGQYQVFAATRLPNGKLIRAVYNKCSIWEIEMAKWGDETGKIMSSLSPPESLSSHQREIPPYLLEKFPCSKEDSAPLTIEVRVGETTHDVYPVNWFWDEEYPELPIPPAPSPFQPQDRQEAVFFYST